MSALADFVFGQLVPLAFAVILAGILLSALTGAIDGLTTRAYDRRRQAEEQEQALRDARQAPKSRRATT
jgi:hypothetical protein